eukprot:810144-Pyramimonas_sp.AAC.1
MKRASPQYLHVCTMPAQNLGLRNYSCPASFQAMMMMMMTFLTLEINTKLFNAIQNYWAR